MRFRPSIPARSPESVHGRCCCEAPCHASSAAGPRLSLPPRGQARKTEYPGPQNGRPGASSSNGRCGKVLSGSGLRSLTHGCSLLFTSLCCSWIPHAAMSGSARSFSPSGPDGRRSRAGGRGGWWPRSTQVGGFQPARLSGHGAKPRCLSGLLSGLQLACWRQKAVNTGKSLVAVTAAHRWCGYGLELHRHDQQAWKTASGTSRHQGTEAGPISRVREGITGV